MAHRREHLISLTAGLFGHHEDWNCIFSSCIIICGNGWAIESIVVGLLEQDIAVAATLNYIVRHLAQRRNSPFVR